MVSQASRLSLEANTQATQPLPCQLHAVTLARPTLPRKPS
ncbi:hypothetical protein UCMB321_1601 [Pseudomonas batumici]|uniref:Uncharacterized protein n=1 Tax=Pseudomonas batumici TaxID=226910 RepID=A0A0C2I647_9PSED|nr:hypothetical protein UCMB321_1601 [Pseudomonas batumici]